MNNSDEKFLYVVKSTFSDEATAEEWLFWMRSKHLREVCAAGAERAALVRIDGARLSFEAHYLFASRAAFSRYEREHAPRLRAEGLSLFPVERGVSYERRTGEIIGHVKAS
jgi:hypothetical protein